MQTLKKSTTKTATKDKPKEDKLKAQEEKLKKSTYNATTPRSYVQKASAADIYQKTPKKLPGSSKDYRTSPMKDYLKSSPSSISQISNSSRISTSTSKSKISQNSVRARTAKDLPFVNVTVNSPIAKRKLNLTVDKNKAADKNTVKKLVDDRKEAKNETKVNKRIDERGDFDRTRSKTRTLDEKEVKQLTADKIDNNEEMVHLKQKLLAKPKAFYVDLDEDNAKAQNRSDEDVSYEDDFESYESDFDSYHSETNSDREGTVCGRGATLHTKGEGGDVEQTGGEQSSETGDEGLKDKDEENMLDSGSFDLREQRSAKSKPTAMEFIMESEEDKAASLDEGFQEGSSAVSSMRTHVEVLERPLFIDFKKSKEKKRKKRIVDEMIRRAKDILSMVTLHEISFTLFEMKPISYDLYMATFGRSNYTQIAVQTFEDGTTEEVQTDEVATENKWTQHPVEFSKSDVYLNDITLMKNRRNSEDYMSKFTLLFEKKQETGNDFAAFKEYKENPLRILLEQKNGSGNCEMLSYETYKSKLKNDYSANSLGRFLKKVENKVSHVLNSNSTVTENVTKSTLPFSSGYVGISMKTVPEEKTFLKQTKITGLIVPEDKNNLILTVHSKSYNGILAGKCIVCLWDVGVARTEPIKILVAIDDVIIGRFRGNRAGLLVAALEDSSIHLWDLSEEPTWRNDVAVPKTDLVEVKTDAMTQIERDREWNLKNSNAGYDQLPIPNALQMCAYTSSAANISDTEVTDRVVGLEFVGVTQDGARSVVGQICSLKRLGVLTIWTIVQEKTKTLDSGKAFWSKIKLEKTQTISLNKILSTKEITDDPFNLNASKRRLTQRKQEKTLARNFSRQKSSDTDRPASVASARKLPAENILPHDWESGVICGDLKIMQYNNTEKYLVAKNNGEVLSCSRSLGVVKVDRLCVSSDTSTLTCLEVSPHGPQFLAAADCGAVHLYSLPEARVLLTLDCRNISPLDSATGPHADFKGRFVDAPRKHVHGASETYLKEMLSMTSVLWSRNNPCCIFALREGALSCWQLTHSDIYPKHTGGRATVARMSHDTLALVTADGEVQVHRLCDAKNTDHAQLFQKYIALL